MDLPFQLPVPDGQALAQVLALGGLAVFLALLLALVSLRRSGRMLRHYRALTTGADGRDLAALLEEATRRLRAAEGRLEALEGATADLEALRRGLREDRAAIQALQVDTADLGNQARRLSGAEGRLEALEGATADLEALRRGLREDRAAIQALQVDTADLGNQARRLSGAEGGLQQLSGRSSQLATRLQLALKHVGLVRYRAFEDVGGDQSFALALLDDDRNGVVLAGLHGRSGDRIYAKPVQQGRSSYALSQEEQEAIARAGRGQPSEPGEA